jgi:hypothetical protein
MRKVLLATTALVAMGGVSAASADVTITGHFSLEYNSWSDNTVSTTTNDSSMVDTSSMFINFSETLDNGMSIAVRQARTAPHPAPWTGLADLYPVISVLSVSVVGTNLAMHLLLPQT